MTIRTKEQADAETAAFIARLAAFMHANPQAYPDFDDVPTLDVDLSLAITELQGRDASRA
jgi:hypothetical protein